MTKTFGAALVGCGSISGVHLKSFAGLELAELKVVVDTDEELAKRTAQQYGCDYLTDYRQLFHREDVQVVHLCTPHHLHAPLAVELLAAGKHVLTEKPMAQNKQAAASLLQAAAQNPNVQLGVIFQNRYNPASQRIKQFLDSGELGKLICMKGLVTWYRNENYYITPWKGKWETEGGGVLINQSIHTLDLLQWFGGEIASIKGSISNDSLEGVIEVEDTAHALIQFKSGVRAIFYATNAYLQNSPVEVELVFEQGTLYMRGDYLYLRKGDQETMLCEPRVNDLGEKSYWGVSHAVQIRDFYEHLAAGKPFWIDAREGVKALTMVLDIYESSRAQKAVPFLV
ncbi:Gfo/Idh/MocA family protein [Paenibacillus hamazuiensis]|uniref:Gfo/Idh/MocA family protein n=1 Tax=Paenibacillus hamazuiensis TaxID=2936508 RepID=UPI00200C7E8E